MGRWMKSTSTRPTTSRISSTRSPLCLHGGLVRRLILSTRKTPCWVEATSQGDDCVHLKRFDALLILNFFDQVALIVNADRVALCNYASNSRYRLLLLEGTIQVQKIK